MKEKYRIFETRPSTNIYINLGFKQRTKIFQIQQLINKQMDPEHQCQQQPIQPLQQQQPLSQNIATTNNFKKYNVQLTVSQANVVMKMLPICYTLQADRQSKNKRQNNRKKNTTKKEMAPVVDPVEQVPQRMKKANSSVKYNEDSNVLGNYNRANSQIYYEDMQDTMKPCLKILQMLKNSKTSWPFREPVDPIVQGVPNYLEIIKQPMDLSTVQNNLKNNIYNSSTQFHADISKIIKNSYIFNKNNPEFCKLTLEFQQYYTKISSDPAVRVQTANFSNRASFPGKTKKPKPIQKVQHKYRQPSQSQPVTLAEKKALALELKRFPKQYLKGVAEIVYEGQPPQSEQLNIENLPALKIRQLQRYVQGKLSMIEQKNQPYKNNGNENEDRSEQSSFESDSDS